MNQLLGIIHAVESSPAMSVVEIDVKGDIFSTIVLETPQENNRLKKGVPVKVVFKETEVVLAKGLSGQISFRNRWPGVIRGIKKESLLTQVVLDYRDARIAAVISTGSAVRLGLEINDSIEWLVKMNEVFLLFDLRGSA